MIHQITEMLQPYASALIVAIVSIGSTIMTLALAAVALLRWGPEMVNKMFNAGIPGTIDGDYGGGPTVFGTSMSEEYDNYVADANANGDPVFSREDFEDAYNRRYG